MEREADGNDHRARDQGGVSVYRLKVYKCEGIQFKVYKMKVYK